MSVCPYVRCPVFSVRCSFSQIFFCKLGLDTQLAIGMGHGAQSPASNLEEDEEYDYDYDYNMVRR